jgi:hypothetical protein
LSPLWNSIVVKEINNRQRKEELDEQEIVFCVLQIKINEMKVLQVGCFWP